MATDPYADVPPEQRHQLETHFLLHEAERDELLGALQRRILEISEPEEFLATLRYYSLAIFRLDCSCLRPLVGIWPPAGIKGRTLDDCLHFAEVKALRLAERILSEARPEIRERLLAELGLQMNAESRAMLADHKRRLADKPRPSSETTSAPSVSKAVVAKRRRIVRAFRTRHDLTAKGLARRVGMSDAAIDGIVREDRKRFSAEKQEKLIAFLGLTVRDWYSE